MTFWTLTFRTAGILTVASIFVAAFASPAAAAAETGPSASGADCLLWYAAPARNWEKEALPIGNSRLGGMVFGGADKEQIQFNEDSLWTRTVDSADTLDFSMLDRGDFVVHVSPLPPGWKTPTNEKGRNDVQ